MSLMNKHIEAEEKKEMQKKRTIKIHDSLTGKTAEFTLINGTYLPAQELAKHGIVMFDPAMMNTAIAKSAISFVDGQKGQLLYRGYAIEELCEQSSFMEAAFLVLNGELPSHSQLINFSKRINEHTFVHTDMLNMMDSFRYDAHPMGMLISCLSGLSTFWPEANPALNGEKIFQNPRLRNKLVARIIGKLPTLAAGCYRKRIGRPAVAPNTSLGYVENFLYMMDALEPSYVPHPTLVRIMEKMFILHIDHSTNCSTAAARHMTSAGTDPTTGLAAAMASLYGPRHGGANEAVVRMLLRIGSKENVPAFIERVKSKAEKLSGFGHRVYKTMDPRANVIRGLVKEVFELAHETDGPAARMMEVAMELERVALQDEYFKSRNLYCNVDFFSGTLYFVLGFPLDFFPVLFAIPRAIGWLAHWQEMQLDPKGFNIVRPKQIYVGHGLRHYDPIEQRNIAKVPDQSIFYSQSSKRRDISLSTMKKSYSNL